MSTTSNKESKELFSFIDKALDCEGSVLDSVDGYNRIRQELVRGFKAAMLEDKEAKIKQNKSFCGCPMCEFHTSAYALAPTITKKGK